MKLARAFRKIWHDFYYRAFGSAGGVEFGLRCRDVVGRLDLREPGKTWTDRARLRLHLSFCEACLNHRRFSEALGRALRDGETGGDRPSVRLERLNDELLRKHARKRER